MSVDAKLLFKVFSPRLVGKLVSNLDKSTAVVISACWLAALVTLVLAFIAVHGAVAAKRDAAAAIASDPILPQATTAPMNPREAQIIVDRLQHQFPDIKFEVGAAASITIKSDDGAKFHQWVTALSYIDTMAPQYRWSLHEFCVGSCSTQGGLMKAVVGGQKVVFSMQ